LGRLFHVESLVRCDGVACARHLQQRRTASRRDQDDLRRDPAIAGLHGQGMCIGKLGARLQDGDAGALEPGAIEAFEPRDLRVLVGDQGGPVEAGRRNAPAEARRVPRNRRGKRLA